MIAMTFLIQPFAAQASPQFCLAKTGLDVGDWFETRFAFGKAGTVMIAFGNHYTIKHPFGFRWFSPSGTKRHDCHDVSH
ncbi:MAG TPA: hypothetical protein IAD19_03530, partial [Candidatus Egerieicola faecale]|nr:hypothetical protein [Candidatus Egerieicola faecale]